MLDRGKQRLEKEKRLELCRKLRSRSRAYSEIIEVKVPLRFYWDNEGQFDGLEFGPIDKLSGYQHRLLSQILNQMCDLMDAFNILRKVFAVYGDKIVDGLVDDAGAKVDVPEAFKRAFDEGGTDVKA